jgi:hypothetical protein
MRSAHRLTARFENTFVSEHSTATVRLVPAEHLLTERFKAQWLQHVLPNLVFKNHTRTKYSQSLCVLCGSQNKQRLFPYTALTDWLV